MERTASLKTPTVTINKILKKFLILVVCLLPFQNLPRIILNQHLENGMTSTINYIRYLDEVAVIISFMILLLIFLMRPRKKILWFPFSKTIAAFLLVAFVSQSINHISMVKGVLGTYDVLKNLLVLYVFAHLRFTRKDVVKLIRALRKIAVVIGVVAIIAEVAAMTWGVGIGYFVREEKRFGLYRVISLTGPGTWNYLGVYMTLLFFLFTAMTKPFRHRKIVLLLTLSTVFLTFSRQAWLGFALMVCCFKKKLIPLGLLVVLVVLTMFSNEVRSFDIKNHFRGFAFVESIKILKAKPALGAGPGMFGSLTAAILGTPYYDNWPEKFREFAIRLRGIDMFWPWIWGEFGLIGLATYWSFFISLFFYLKKVGLFFHNRGDQVFSNLGGVMRYFLLSLWVMGFGGGLNAAFVVFTYFALVGMYISAYLLEKEVSLSNHENSAG